VKEPFEVERIEKPWGHEIIWARTRHYVGKILFVKAGEALSLQYHERKDETLYLHEGRLRLEVGDGDDLEALTMKPGDAYRVRPGTRHRMTAESDCLLLEASTDDLDDVVRLEDRYGRS
jgi:mannose-6-phosphate isomerase-like protein (cupin superfamily)